jgi:hypothetical protein
MACHQGRHRARHYGQQHQRQPEHTRQTRTGRPPLDLITPTATTGDALTRRSLTRSAPTKPDHEPNIDPSGHPPKPHSALRVRQPERRTYESVFARLVATAGIVGIGAALSAILVAANVAGWIAGLVVSIVTVALAAMLWRSRRL